MRQAEIIFYFFFLKRRIVDRLTHKREEKKGRCILKACLLLFTFLKLYFETLKKKTGSFRGACLSHFSHALVSLIYHSLLRCAMLVTLAVPQRLFHWKSALFCEIFFK